MKLSLFHFREQIKANGLCHVYDYSIAKGVTRGTAEEFTQQEQPSQKMLGVNV